MTVVGFKFRSVRGIFLSLTLIVVFANDKKSVVQSPTNSSLQTKDNILRRIITNRLSRELQVTSRNNYSEKNGKTSREELKADYIKSMSDSMVDKRRSDVANEDGTLRRRDRRNLERKRKGAITKRNSSAEDSQNVPVEEPVKRAPKEKSSSTIYVFAAIGILLVIAILVAVVKRNKIKEFLEKEKLGQSFDIKEIVATQQPKPNEMQTLIDKENDKSTGAPETAATGAPGSLPTGAPGAAATGAPGSKGTSAPGAAATGVFGSRPTGAPGSKPTGAPGTAATFAPGSKGTGAGTKERGAPGIAATGSPRSKSTGALGSTGAGVHASKGTGAHKTTGAGDPVSRGAHSSKSKRTDVPETKATRAPGTKPVVLVPPGLKSKAPPEARR